ncbi:MAG: hypothetical protein JXR83_03605 [Deltaproteobacteria bacterium]|nr:hypothetical protein [Deltaproteobacteria bacterium]
MLQALAQTHLRAVGADPAHGRPAVLGPPGARARGRFGPDPAPAGDADKFKSSSKGQRIVMLDQIRKACNASGDPKEMDKVDLFRNRLDPAAQAEYDRQLEQLRNDPRIRITDPNGNPVDLATRELILRGMLAATFPDAQMLNNAIQTGCDSRYDPATGEMERVENGTFDIVYYPRDYAGKDKPYGVCYWDGRIGISEECLGASLLEGENGMLHEFSHALQVMSNSGQVAKDGAGYPEDFPFANEVNRAFMNDPELRQYLLDRFGKIHDNPERFTTLQTLFRTEPEKLKEICPELYDLMVRYTGFDPIAGRILPRGPERKPTEPPAAPAEPAAPTDKGGRSWWDRIISWVNPTD